MAFLNSCISAIVAAPGEQITAAPAYVTNCFLKLYLSHVTPHTIANYNIFSVVWIIGGLSAGGVAGVVFAVLIAVIFVIICVVCICYCCVKRGTYKTLN